MSDPDVTAEAAAGPPFVPDGFVPPAGLDHPAFLLRPLGPEHNASDYAAWTPSMEHIGGTPGFEGMGWPRPMTLEENLGDLVRHAADFAARTGFTYTVLAPGEGDPPTVIGCVYIYPAEGFDDPGEGFGDPAEGFGARVRSWVRSADAGLDGILYCAVRDWLAAAWPFARVDDAPRPDAS